MRAALNPIAWSAVLLSAIVLPSPVQAQVEAQLSGLGTTGTIVTPNGTTIDITGGAIGGTNLFHSFQKFELNQNQTANFLASPSIQNILGRVVGGEASVINGVIRVSGSSNPNLYLMNPAGIIFGSSASLNVPGSFTATTANGIGFATGWFNAVGANGYTSLTDNPNSIAFAIAQPGVIVNAANLAVGQGQSLTLLGGLVVNTGTLTAPEGNITIVAIPGEKLVRVSQPGSLLSLDLPVADRAALNPSSLTPLSLPELLTGGTIASAVGVTLENGQVKLTGSGVTIPTESGVAIVSNQLNASGNTGGTVHVLGSRVGLVSANINASGTNGGGTVLVGGDFQGNGTVPNAQQTYVSRDSVINVDARTNGNGGRAIVWADGATQFFGSISARGGSQSGNGGFAEVSGKQNLTFDGTTDLSAPNGMLGSLLLDPINIQIVAGNSAPDDNQLADGQILSTDSPTTSFTISKAALEAITGNVQLEATNDIAIDPGISLSFSSNPPGSATPGGSITFIPNSDSRNGGSFSMSADATIQTNGRDIKIRPRENSFFEPGPTNIFVGNISTSGGNLELDGSVVLRDNTIFNTSTPTGRDGNISLGSINSDGAAVPRDLRLSAGDGEISSFRGVGGTSQLGDFIASGQRITVSRASATGLIRLTASDSLSSSELNARDLQLDVQQGSVTLDRGNFNATNQLSLNARDGLTIISSRLIADPVSPLSFVRLSSDNTVSILDRPGSPTVIQSGRSIYVQGNQAIQISARNDPASLFQSVSSTTLASNGAIVADGNFTGGAFEAIDLRGRPTNLASSNTLIRANGDVTFGDYGGLALKVESTGSIQGGNIRILAPNRSLTGADPDIAILNSSPSLILRAGVTTLGDAPNVPADLVSGTRFSTSGTPSSPATITVGNIDTSVVVGRGGSVTLNAPGRISTGGIDTRSSDSSGAATAALFQFGGAVDIESDRQIATGNISTRGGAVRVAGSDLQLGIIDSYNKSFNPIGIRDLFQQGAVKLESRTGDIIVRSIRSGVGGIDINSAGRFVATDATFEIRLSGIGTSNIGEQIELRSSPELINFLVSQGFGRAELEQSKAKLTLFTRQTTPTSVFAYSQGPDAPSNIRIRHSGKNGFSSETLQIVGGGANVDFAIAPNTEPGFVLPSFESLSGFNPNNPNATLFLERNDRFLPVQEFPSYYSGTAGAIIVGSDDNSQLFASPRPIPFVPRSVTIKEEQGGADNGGINNSSRSGNNNTESSSRNINNSDNSITLPQTVTATNQPQAQTETAITNQPQSQAQTSVDSTTSQTVQRQQQTDRAALCNSTTIAVIPTDPAT
ncbi:MAG TPA: filamentous hemagglutinin N-terminal domain-containing protein, partial [Thermosynechococcaceae cyanobacterium]